MSNGRGAAKKRLRVLTVIDGLGFAGGESRILSMGCGLDPERFEHSVLTINPAYYSAAHEYAARRAQYVSAGIPVHDLAEVAPESRHKVPRMAHGIYAKTGVFRRAKRLASVLREWRVDAVDSHLESAGLVSVLAGRIRRTPVSMTMYCGIWQEAGMVWPWTTKAALRLADRVLTDSQIRASQMSDLVPKQREKFFVIPNGIHQPKSDRTESEMRQLLGLPSEPRVRIIAQIGRLTEYKGQSVLLQAARKVLNEDPNVAFLIVGHAREESYKARLRKLVEDLGIRDRVVITEYAGSIGDIWKVVDIHAHASLFDSLPISIAEGMSLGKPAAVTSAGGIPEIVAHEQTGLVVPPGDADALASALLKLLREPQLARMLGDSARARYLNLYRPETMARALEDYFTRMVGHSAVNHRIKP